jgi:predicted transcriptional regulator
MIKDIRKEIDRLGLRQDFIAKKLKISNAYLTMLIKGQRTNKDKINAIINYLKKRSNEAA